MAFGDIQKILDDFMNEFAPIVAVIQPTRYERFWAWITGKEARVRVIRQIVF